MENDKSYYTVCEMARYSGIPAKTLRYYDEIGLFSPAFRNEDTQYRYYMRTQLEQVMLLQSLKSLGMSLRDIKTEFNHMDSKRYVELLKTRSQQLEQEIAALSQRKRNIDSLVEEADEAINAELNCCYLRRYPALYGYVYPYRITSRMELELGMREMEKSLGNAQHISRVRRIISLNDIRCGNYLVYSGFFIPADSVTETHWPTYKIPAQDYAVIFTDAVLETSIPAWEKLLAFIRESGCRITGDGYRIIPVENGISQIQKDYVAKIIVPIQKLPGCDSGD